MAFQATIRWGTKKQSQWHKFCLVGSTEYHIKKNSPKQTKPMSNHKYLTFQCTVSAPQLNVYSVHSNYVKARCFMSPWREENYCSISLLYVPQTLWSSSKSDYLLLPSISANATGNHDINSIVIYTQTSVTCGTAIRILPQRTLLSTTAILPRITHPSFNGTWTATDSVLLCWQTYNLGGYPMKRRCGFHDNDWSD
jgi:hypothetical protein